MKSLFCAFKGGVFAVFSTLAFQVSSAIIPVTSTADLVATDGACTLREAIDNANLDAGSPHPDCNSGSGRDQIRLTSLNGTIVLNSSLPDIQTSMDIIGPGSSQLTLDGNHAHSILSVYAPSPAPAPEVIISGLTFARAHNGALGNSAGMLKVNRCAFTDNTTSYEGAAIFSQGTTTVVASQFINNRSEGDGGAIYQIMETLDYAGYGPLNVYGSRFTRNTSGGSGGAIHAFGGYWEDVVHIHNTTFNLNSTMYDGGALYALNSNFQVSNSVFYENEGRRGGGIMSIDTEFDLNNTTLSNNQANQGGGIFLFNLYGEMRIANATLTNNNGFTETGGIHLYYEGVAGPVMSNSIVAGNKLGGSFGPGADCAIGSPFASAGYNLFANASGCSGLTTRDLAINPGAVAARVLRPIGNYGGPTFTNALKFNPRNPATNAGNPAGCLDTFGMPLTVDQRGLPRPSPSGLRCDIGAYENPVF